MNDFNRLLNFMQCIYSSLSTNDCNNIVQGECNGDIVFDVDGCQIFLQPGCEFLIKFDCQLRLVSSCTIFQLFKDVNASVESRKLASCDIRKIVKRFEDYVYMNFDQEHVKQFLKLSNKVRLLIDEIDRSIYGDWRCSA